MSVAPLPPKLLQIVVDKLPNDLGDPLGLFRNVPSGMAVACPSSVLLHGTETSSF